MVRTYGKLWLGHTAGVVLGSSTLGWALGLNIIFMLGIGLGNRVVVGVGHMGDVGLDHTVGFGLCIWWAVG